MAATYKQFLAAPSSSLLADTAALHYVTTTTTLSGPTQIIKHLNALSKEVAKKKEDILNVIDGGRVIVVEADTGLGFQTGGGPYLPGLDDNLLATRVAYLPITHIVTFDEAGKISQIRISWDQGSLLKQVEVIGKSGRNWPIRDSQDQLTFIQACLKSAGTNVASTPSHNEVIIRTRGKSGNAMRDPHASLQLFGPRDEVEAPSNAGIISPYAGTKPRQRGFTEILGDEPGEGYDASQYTMSPSKKGQGKNFQPMRIFDGQDDHPREPEQPKENMKRYIQPNAKKYTHFDFADGTDPQDAPQKGQSFKERPKSKHDSNWDFDGFMTPQKVKPSRTLRAQTDNRHWDTDKDAMAETPAHNQTKPRRDQETHFGLQDEDDDQDPSNGPKHRGNNTTTHAEALGNITNLKHRGDDFDPHFSIADNSPAPSAQDLPIRETHKKAVKMMNANWSSYDKSPARKENAPLGTDPSAGINIAGDGMGGRKGTNRDWLYGGADEELPQAIPPRGGKAPASSNDVPATGNKESINIAGDGMGGRKGTGRDFLFGNDDQDASSVPTRKPGNGPVENYEPQASRIINIAGDGMGSRKAGIRDYLQQDTDEAPRAVPGRKQGADPAEDTSKKTGINIAGDGMGGRKGGLRDYLEADAEDTSKAVPGRKQGSDPVEDTSKKTGINIAGDGMGGRKGGLRDYLEADADDTPKAVPGRKQGADPVEDTSKKTGINIAGDGMGGRRGANHDWLYGQTEAQEAPQPVQPRRKVNNPNQTSRDNFWDF